MTKVSTRGWRSSRLFPFRNSANYIVRWHSSGFIKGQSLTWSGIWNDRRNSRSRLSLPYHSGGMMPSRNCWAAGVKLVNDMAAIVYDTMSAGGCCSSSKWFAIVVAQEIMFNFALIENRFPRYGMRGSLSDIFLKLVRLRLPMSIIWYDWNFNLAESWYITWQDACNRVADY